jgi:hypothetical protein
MPKRCDLILAGLAVAASTSSAQADAAGFRSVDTAGFAAAIEKSPQSSAFRKQSAR